MSLSNILRFATAGSVDDGKSSLIGRLLYDTKSVLEDQMRSIEHSSRQRGSEFVELALLTDGLRAEREQNITIDVAYRYFSTLKRKFIIADTPGHVQYTRNMVTGTSTADLSVILVDARKGVLSQSKRHAAISALLGIRHVVVAVNKMDLVDYNEDVFDEITSVFESFARRLGIPNVDLIPISALIGDNVVDASCHMPWYSGRTLLQFLEQVEISHAERESLRLPIQYVIRPNQDFRGLAGRLESGSLRIGDQVAVSSTGLKANVKSILVAGVESTEGIAGQAVTVELDRDIDVSRGDLLYASQDPPKIGNRIEAVICWMDGQPLQIEKRYLLLHGTSRVSATVERVINRLDVDSLEPHTATTLGMNDIGRVDLHMARKLAFDDYSELPATGSFVLVDPATNATVAGGMIQGLSEWVNTDQVKEGSVFWLAFWAGDLNSLATKLKHFGKHTPVVTQLDFACYLASQSFDVVYVGEGAIAGAIRLDSNANEESVVEAILQSA